jgi:hypothetical protein
MPYCAWSFVLLHLARFAAFVLAVRLQRPFQIPFRKASEAASASVDTSMLYAIVFTSCHNHAPSATGTKWPEFVPSCARMLILAFVSTTSRQH